jgi:hypothetical protein
MDTSKAGLFIGERTFIGEATLEQIAQWKADVKKKFGEETEVFSYTKDNMICYLRSVDRDAYASAAAKVSTSPAKFNDVILENIWLGGCDKLKTVNSYYFGLIDFVEELMDKKKGVLTKL